MTEINPVPNKGVVIKGDVKSRGRDLTGAARVLAEAPATLKPEGSAAPVNPGQSLAAPVGPQGAPDSQASAKENAILRLLLTWAQGKGKEKELREYVGNDGKLDLNEAKNLGMTEQAYKFVSVGGDVRQVKEDGTVTGDDAIEEADAEKVFKGTIEDIAKGTGQEKAVIEAYLNAERFALVNKDEAVARFNGSTLTGKSAKGILDAVNPGLRTLATKVLTNLGVDLKSTTALSTEVLGSFFITLSFLGQLSDENRAKVMPEATKDMQRPSSGSTDDYFTWLFKNADKLGLVKGAEKPAGTAQVSEKSADDNSPVVLEIGARKITQKQLEAAVQQLQEQDLQLGTVKMKGKDLAPVDQKVQAVQMFIQEESSAKLTSTITDADIQAYLEDSKLTATPEMIKKIREDQRGPLSVVFWKISQGKIKKEKIAKGMQDLSKNIKYAQTTEGQALQKEIGDKLGLGQANKPKAEPPAAKKQGVQKTSGGGGAKDKDNSADAAASMISGIVGNKTGTQ